jgi:UDP-N-acetylmuramate dehydrogenase
VTVNAPQADVPLAPMTTLGVGGVASWFQTARRAADVASAHAWAHERDLPVFPLGGGSNLVIADTGVHGLVLRIAIEGRSFTRDGDDTILQAGAGEAWDAVVAESVGRGLAGLECLSGIPGSVGGTPIQNVGAYGQEVAEAIEQVEAFDRNTGSMRSFSSAECGFSYRMSRFKREDAGRFVICAVRFRLRPGRPSATYPDVVRRLEEARIAAPTVADVRATVLAIRRGKGMVVDENDPDTRSVGSFFMNPVVTPGQREEISRLAGTSAPGFTVPEGIKIPAAWLIERAGLQRGWTDGAVGISSKHPLAIVNRGGATATDVIRVATTVKQRVLDCFGVTLRTEPVFLGFEDDGAVAFLQRG